MAEEWSYIDIPIMDYQVTYTADHVTGEINLITRVMDRVTTEILQSKDDQLRNALIDLGWRPPDDNGN